MARSPRAGGPVALVVVVSLSLLAAACSNGDDAGSSAPRRDPDRSNGGPTTSTRPGPAGPGSSPVRDGIRIEVLSSQPDRISGDDARIRVTPAAGRSPSELRVRLGDQDVTAQLQPVEGSLEGVVTGLVEGDDTLTASGAGPEVIQRLRAWPLSGPIVSGPHLPLLACSTVELGLGPPTDTDCSAPPKVTWRYVGTDQQVRDLPDPDQRPSDLATTTVDGRTVPFYIRYEQGVINRSVYAVASIDATPGDPAVTDDEPGWNHKVLYRYGGGCGTTYGQGTSMANSLEPAYLAQGYAVATATFNALGTQCNDVLSAETTMMVKERLIEEFGVPRFTIGEGASGGAMQLHLQTQNYPGLVDGVVAELPFPDLFTVNPGATDCGLLLRYEQSPAGSALTDRQRQAIAGHASPATCGNWRDRMGPTLDPATGCDPKIAPEEIYDAEGNTGGLRCTLQDANRNQLGLDPVTGFAERPLDNVGVQYGLAALNDRVMTVDEFLDLNAGIGGYDVDGGFQAERQGADPDAIARAYETGRIANGGGDLLAVPIVDVTVFADPRGDVHDRFWAFSLRDRLAPADNPETAPGFQIWTRDASDPAVAAQAASAERGEGTLGVEAVGALDRWLSAIESDREGGDRRSLLRRTRPDDAVDNCRPAGSAETIGGVGIYDKAGPCRDRYPVAGDPRTAAGAPRRNDILKCELQPVDPRRYDVTFTSAQLDRLDRIFPDGVCDYRQAGAGQTVPAQPDRSYDDVITPQQRA